MNQSLINSFMMDEVFFNAAPDDYVLWKKLAPKNRNLSILNQKLPGKIISYLSVDEDKVKI